MRAQIAGEPVALLIDSVDVLPEPTRREVVPWNLLDHLYPGETDDRPDGAPSSA